MADNNLSSQEACCESGCEEEEALSKITEKDDSRVKTHKNEDVDFLPAGRIPSDEDEEHNQSSSSLPKIEEESSDQQPSQEPELLLKLSEKGIVERVMSILDKDPSLVNCKDSDGYTPLHRASYNGHADVVRVLLQRGANVDARTEDGWQPLHCACRWGEYIAFNIHHNLGREWEGRKTHGDTHRLGPFRPKIFTCHTPCTSNSRKYLSFDSIEDINLKSEFL